MSEVTMTLNGRTYRLECDDGEEEHLLALSEQVGKRLNRLVKEFGQVGDDRLLLMTALMIADELGEANRRLENVEAEQASADQNAKSAESSAAGKIAEAAERIEVLSEALNEGTRATKGK